MNINKKPFWALISLCKQDSKTSNVTVIGLQSSIWCHISASFLWRWMPKSYLLFSNHKLHISQRIIVIWPWGRHCKTHQIKGLRTIHVHIIVRFVDVFITLRNTHTRIYIYIYIYIYIKDHAPWWRHQIETVSVLLALCEGKGHWRGALICAWTNSWAKHRDAGDLWRHRAHSLWRHCSDTSDMSLPEPLMIYCQLGP